MHWNIYTGDEHISKYHLSGYSRCDLSVGRMLAVAAFSPLAAESTLLELFEDDRFLMRSEMLWVTVTSEIRYIFDIVPSFVWERVANLVSLGMSGQEFC